MRSWCPLPLQWCSILVGERQPVTAAPMYRNTLDELCASRSSCLSATGGGCGGSEPRSGTETVRGKQHAVDSDTALKRLGLRQHNREPLRSIVEEFILIISLPDGRITTPLQKALDEIKNSDCCR